MISSKEDECPVLKVLEQGRRNAAINIESLRQGIANRRAELDNMENDLLSEESQLKKWDKAINKLREKS